MSEVVFNYRSGRVAVTGRDVFEMLDGANRAFVYMEKAHRRVRRRPQAALVDQLGDAALLVRLGRPGGGAAVVRRRQPEQDLQRACAGLLGSALVPGEAWWCHVPNGGARSPLEAAIFAGIGVCRGVPDLLIVHRGRCFWIKLKAGRNERSPDQCRVAFELIGAGCETACARSVEEVEALLRFWNIPLRSRPLPGVPALVARWCAERGLAAAA